MALDTEGRRIDLGNRLRELRAGRPQRLVADRLDVTERTYGKWERGEGGIQWKHLEAAAEFYGVTTNYLLFGVDEHPRRPGDQLQRIEDKLDEVLRLLSAAVPYETPEEVLADAPARLLETNESTDSPAPAEPLIPRAARQRKNA